MHRPQDPPGSTIIELTVAIAIVGVAILVLLQQITLSHHEGESSRDKVFAYQKALGMLAEIQVAITRREIGDVTGLEARADSLPSPVLTTLRPGGFEVAPDHPMSGNLLRGAEWTWLRRVSISAQPGARGMRRVEVEVLRRPDAGGPPRVAAAVSALVQVAEAAAASVQEFDVYVLALAAVPSTSLPPAGMRAVLETAVASLEERSPGLRFRLHWISELGYGRDPLYVPFVNEVERAVDAAPLAYWYPGRIDEVSPALFAAEHFGGRIRTEVGLVNGYDPAANPHPFSVADRFNHAMREPAARDLFERRVAAGLADADAPPLQLLLADMHAAPERFRNAILVNLHGDVLPYPPLRNESDAARDPEHHPGVRVVTHPAQLRPARDPDGDGLHGDSEDLELRVHAYKLDPVVGPAVLPVPITLRILGVDLSANVNGADPSLPTTLEVRRLPGGVDPGTGVGSGVHGYAEFDSADGLPPELASRGAPFEMAIEWGFATSPEPHTWLRLHHTPLIAPPVEGRGLAPSDRLYGMDHVPSPVVAAGSGGPRGDFAVDLASAVAGPKNTARWRIRVPAAVFAPGFPGGGLEDIDQRLSFETLLGDDPAAGTAWPHPIRPRARSVGYAWWARSPDAVPLTERYQILGDPRLCPYADLVAGGRSFPHGYSRYFDDLRGPGGDATALWPCLDPDRLGDGFAGVQADVPRLAQVWREALVASSAILAQGGGRLLGAVSFGGEVCQPAEIGGLGPRALEVAGAWFGTSGAVQVDQLSPADPLTTPAAPGGGALGGSRGASTVVELGGGFWARPWLGELAPDTAASDWASLGNLPTSGAGARFVAAGLGAVDPAALPVGTSFDRGYGGLLDARGGASFLLQGSAGRHFRQTVGSGSATGVPESAVRELFLAVGVGRPYEEPARLGYGLEEPLDPPLPPLHAADLPPHFVQEIERLALGADQRSTSGVIRLLAPDGNRAGFVMLDGGTPLQATAQPDALRVALVHAMRTFHVAGHPALDGDLVQLPRVVVLGPENGLRVRDPARLELRWRSRFERFDGAPYTSGYPADFDGGEDGLRYRVLVTADEGLSWTDVLSGLPVDLAARTEPEDLLWDSGPGDEGLTVETPPATYPGGSYRFRVLCQHAGRGIHRAWHEVRVEIERGGEEEE
jgi:hypothetical protein